jgi:hypothetical protein
MLWAFSARRCRKWRSRRTSPRNFFIATNSDGITAILGDPFFLRQSKSNCLPGMFYSRHVAGLNPYAAVAIFANITELPSFCEIDRLVSPEVQCASDEKKGERLVVVHTLADEALKGVLEKLAKADLPALWKPRPDQFVAVEQLPYLGMGKLDLRKLKEMALAHLASAAKVNE